MDSKKKLRAAVIILLIIASIAGLVLLILSSREFTDVAFDLIILLIAVVTIGIALYSQVAADKEARRVEKLAPI